MNIFDLTPYLYDADEHPPALPLELAHLYFAGESLNTDQLRYLEQAHQAQGMATLLAVLAADELSHFLVNGHYLYFFREQSKYFTEGLWNLHGNASQKLCRVKLLAAGSMVLAKALHALYHSHYQEEPVSLGGSPWDEGGSMH